MRGPTDSPTKRRASEGALRARYRLIALTFLVATGACQNYGTLQTESIHDESVDFSQYRTFAQAAPPGSVPSSPRYNMLVGNRIRGWISTEMKMKGLSEVAWDEADLQIAFTLNGKPRTEVWITTIGWYRSHASTARYLDGALAIDMADPRRGRMVWHGLATQQTLDAEFSDERTQRAVERLLERFPPQPKD